MEGFYEVLKSLFLNWKSFFEVFMKVFFKRLYEAHFEQLRVLFESPLLVFMKVYILLETFPLVAYDIFLQPV